MRNIEIVGGLVQKQDVRFLQQKLTQKYLSTLTAGQLGNILVQTDFGKPEGAANLLNLGIDHIKIVCSQKLLQRSGALHQLLHGILVCFAHLFINPV